MSYYSFPCRALLQNDIGSPHSFKITAVQSIARISATASHLAFCQQLPVELLAFYIPPATGEFVDPCTWMEHTRGGLKDAQHWDTEGVLLLIRKRYQCTVGHHKDPISRTLRVLAQAF